MAESRKAWIKPELVILVRNKPEEAVLDTCKGKLDVVGPNQINRECLTTLDISCFNCDNVAIS